MISRLILPFAALCLTTAASRTMGEEMRVYIGTYTKEGGSKGIYAADFDGATGQLGKPTLVAEVASPSFLTIDPSGKALYAVSENRDRVTAYRVEADGTLTKLNDQSSAGGGPCYVTVSPDGKTLALANYGGGSIASYRIEEDGSLSAPVTTIQHVGSSVDPKRQKGPHAHSINFSLDGRYAYAADLGTDRVYVYAVDAATGALKAAGETVIEPGSGPRHLAFRPDGKFAYLINEMTLRMKAFRVDAPSGALTEIQSLSTLPAGTDPVGSTAEVVAHPSGKFLYGSNRGHDSIVVYTIDEAGGKLTHVENEPIQGKTPRNFVVSPDGKWLLAAGQGSDSVTVFAIDPEKGSLTYAGSRIEVSSPVCLRFLKK